MKEPRWKNGQRHIVYAIVFGLLHVRSRHMVKTVSDHHCVQYDISWKDWENLRVRPKAIELSECKCDSARWHAIWSRHADAYSHAAQTDAQEAWTILSKAAEEALCPQEGWRLQLQLQRGGCVLQSACKV